jgi:hypothetical protein
VIPAAIGFGGLGVVAGLGVALQNGLPLARANASRRWQSTIGRVRSARAQSYSVQLGRGGTYSGFAPAIAVEYTVGEQQFEHTAYVDGGSKDLDAVEATVRHYHVGQTVTVRYDPSRPTRAMVEGEYLGGSEALTFFGCIVCALSVVMMVSSL